MLSGVIWLKAISTESRCCKCTCFYYDFFNGKSTNKCFSRSHTYQILSWLDALDKENTSFESKRVKSENIWNSELLALVQEPLNKKLFCCFHSCNEQNSKDYFVNYAVKMG